ncbi:cupin domain-containing protein [Rubrivivax sp. RP6-9]|uniref:cupin domain-containing protein n=1 Tax=Rubrivivax sp. RP6-9 TaxID=3415750 RepID=UPI003CC59E16
MSTPDPSPAATPAPFGFDTFAGALRAQGFDEVLERRWAPGTVLETHTHPFDAKAVVVQGEMWLTEGTQTRHLRPGDGFALAAGTPHAERYGSAGATYWVGRRNTGG